MSPKNYQISADINDYDLQNVECQSLAPSCEVSSTVAARGEIGREGCEISSLDEHMGLSPCFL